MKTVQDTLTLSPDEIDTLTHKMYDAIASDPEGYMRYIFESHNQWEKKLKEGKITSNYPKLGIKLANVENKISNKYSREFVKILNTPYFLRVKITEISSKKYIAKDGFSYDQTILKGKVEDVVKGTIRFKKGSFIIISYLDHLIQFKSNGFHIGESYFIPLKVSIPEESNYTGLLVQFYEDDNAAYPIKNEKIYVKGDYFKLGEQLNWSTFKDRFVSHYIIN